ncbi:LYR motif-containing protein 9 isoform X2 [Aethina tumida]|uniref:LYR motif-containing protein 9 isoform X2 n=1 Tax=Aethina tumida TaxID=116153 RepID=UPI0021480372|nr:LYR motif-containing protein 9 isoform X2 [Aethina tumida]
MVVFRKISTQIATFCNKPNNDSPKSLYKYLIRACKKLPDGPKKHYQFMVKQSFKQHVNESDPERIKQIIQRSYEDADWILKKYLKK